jgi:TrmH family RNA methyltransferase
MQMFTWKTNEEIFEGLVNGGTFELKRNVLAAMLAGENCAEVARELDDGNNSNNKVCLVLGSEGQGVSEEIASSIRAITIPTPGVTESLNVAVAGGILMSSLTVR